MGIKLISRNDDFGSSRAANKAILEAVECGVITRNVSCMAPAPHMAEAAEKLKKYHHIDIGMHATVTAEWEGIRWGALTGAMRDSVWTYEDGTFFHSVQELSDAKPDVELVIKEYQAQLDYLTGLGLNVRYVDSHMFPEYAMDDLYEAFLDWIYAKGLLCAEDYYLFAEPPCPPMEESEGAYLTGIGRWLSRLADGKQYFYLAHPACPYEETLQMYNANIPRGKMRMERGLEYKAVTSRRWERWLAEYEIEPVRYSQAERYCEDAFETGFEKMVMRRALR